MLKCLSCSSDLTLCLLPLIQSAEELFGTRAVTAQGDRQLWPQSLGFGRNGGVGGFVVKYNVSNTTVAFIFFLMKWVLLSCLQAADGEDPTCVLASSAAGWEALCCCAMGSIAGVLRHEERYQIWRACQWLPLILEREVDTVAAKGSSSVQKSSPKCLLRHLLILSCEFKWPFRDCLITFYFPFIFGC